MFHETDTQFTESLFVLHCKLNSFQGLLLSTANLKLVVQNHVTELKAKHKNYKFCILNKLTGTTGYWQVPPVTVLASHLSPPQANSSIWYDTLACHILLYMYPFLVSCIYKIEFWDAAGIQYNRKIFYLHYFSRHCRCDHSGSFNHQWKTQSPHKMNSDKNEKRNRNFKVTQISGYYTSSKVVGF